MSHKTYSQFSTHVTPQTEPIPGEQQVKNSAGGFVYELDQWKTLERFLILGTEGGTYYVKEQKLTKDNALNVLTCLEADWKRTIDTICAISDAGRAPKNTPAEFALALAAASKNDEARVYALAALPEVCRIPTHLFHFLNYVKKQRGFGRGLRTGIENWYKRWDADQLAFELLKYQSRDGWSNRDAFRLSHANMGNTPLMRWAVAKSADARDFVRKNTGVGKYPAAEGSLPAVIAAFEEAKTADTPRLIALIREHGLTREMLPTEALTKPDVWDALLEKMPPHALLRNLGNMSKVGLLTPMSAASATVVEKLRNAETSFRKNRVHPLAVLIALKVYGQGHGMKGSGEWEAVPAVMDALNDAFYVAFDTLEPTGKRLLFGVDVSASMSGGSIAGSPLTPAEGAAAMAMACARTESQYHIMGFAHEFRNLGITPKMTFEQALRKTTDMNFGSTDCALPMQWAMENKAQVDAFIVITDNETWAGGMHPKQALAKYRQQSGLAAKQVVIGMTATSFSIADPKDPLTLDVVGFDASTPQAVAEFIR